MTRRRLLGSDTWAGHLEPPIDDREIARHYTLARDDLDSIATKRGDANRLGYGLVTLYLRYPGRVLEAGEVPPDAVLAYVARQLGTKRLFDDYAGLSVSTLDALDGLLDTRPPGKLTWLGWLRNAPQSPAPRSVVSVS